MIFKRTQITVGHPL